MYDLLNYSLMIADDVRTNSYLGALEKVINSDSVVLDIGTGTGIFALAAARFGARKVYAVETENYIQVAKELAEANHYRDRIRFIQDDSTHIELPEKVSVIVSDMRGTLPLYSNHIPAIIDARERLLATAGILIPQQDTLWATLVNAEEIYKKYTAPWTGRDHGIDMAQVLPMVTNNLWGCGAGQEGITQVTEPQCWARINYPAVRNSSLSGELEWKIDQATTIHGIRAWFDSELVEGIGFSNAPDQPALIYGNVIFPLQAPISVDTGDMVKVSIAANLVDDNYIWRWDSKVFEKNNQVAPKVEFSQSNFYGAPLSTADIHKRAAGYRPSLSDDGKVMCYILNRMNEGTILEQIAAEVVQRFPDRFSDRQQALNHIGQLSVKYS